MFARVGMVIGAGLRLGYAVTIATRYNAVRI